MTDDSKHVLLIFIKNPEAGKVKTRLAKAVGAQKALQIYRQLLAITHNVTGGLSCDRQVWYSRFIDSDDQWEAEKYEKRLQGGADLGERMKEAFRRAFADGYKKAVIIGSDCADLTQAIIEEAFEALSQNEVVIGPSQDGGYYLLGMRAFYGDLFNGINWSTPTVYEETIGRADELELSYCKLPTLNDIDTRQDLIQSNAKLGDV